MLVYFTVARVRADAADAGGAQSPIRGTVAHLRNPQLRAAFGIGFCILFAFIGTFTFVNFVLVRAAAVARHDGSRSRLFRVSPSVVTTLLAGRAVARFGTRPTIWAALAVAGVGLPLMLSAASAGGSHRHGAGRRRHVLRAGVRHRLRGQAASDNRGIASGTYLACYFLGGMVGSAVLGQLFDRLAGRPASPGSARRLRLRRY